MLESSEKSHRKVLNIIRLYKEVSGAVISKITKYQPSTIVYVLKSLRKRGLIEISRIADNTGLVGKPPILWRLVKDKGFIIGIEITTYEIRLIIIDFASNIFHKEIKSLHKYSQGNKIVSDTINYVEDVIAKLKLPKEKIIGIGVALSGLVDSHKGIVYYSRRLSLKNFRLKETIEESLKLPIEISNDANAGVLGVKWYYRSVETLPQNIVFLTIDEKFQDIGAGLILNNNLYDGSSGTAGELLSFHISYPDITKIIKMGEKKYGINYSNISGLEQNMESFLSEIAVRSEHNCPISNFILENISHNIVKIIVHIIEFINPNLIVIGGNINSDGCILNDSVLPNVEREISKMFPIGVKIPKIVTSQFGIYSVSAGATALIIRNIFKT